MSEALLSMSMSEYQSNLAYSRSDLMLIKKSGYHLKAKRERLFPEKDKAAFVLGELVHCIVLEPDEVESRYIGLPKIDRRTKAGKEMYAEFLEQSNGKIVIDEDTFNKASYMATNLSEQEIVSKSLKGCVIERSLLWHDDESGLDFKCRPDAYNPDKGTVIDVKTTKDASERGFTSSAVHYGYFLQASMIREGLKANGLPFSAFVFLCVENTEPYVCGSYILDDEALDKGLDEFCFLKKKLATCIHENTFSHYPLRLLTCPSWALNDYEE